MTGVINVNTCTFLRASHDFIWHVSSVRKMVSYNGCVNISQYEGQSGFYDPSVFCKKFTI
jgi:hypothetical protein